VKRGSGEFLEEEVGGVPEVLVRGTEAELAVAEGVPVLLRIAVPLPLETEAR
jgi:hypothetical protein